MKKASLLLILLFLHIYFSLMPATAKGKAPDIKVKKYALKKLPKRKLVSDSRIKIAKRNRYPGTRARRARSMHSRRFTAIRSRRVRFARDETYLTVGDRIGLNLTENTMGLKSNVALILDESTSSVLFSRNSEAVLPIASITKLMTAFVVLEARQDMKELLTVTSDDIDHLKHTTSRLPIGARLSRSEMLHIALMSSENRAASALGRHFPGGLSAFVETMNAQAKLLGMTDTHYVEPTGLSSRNVSSARDLAKLVAAAQAYPLIREYSTAAAHVVTPGGRTLQYWNTNRLIRNSGWDIVLQKTGYIAEAGRCLVMKVLIDGRSIIMVFLDAKGKYSRASDAKQIRAWLENIKLPALTQTPEKSEG